MELLCNGHRPGEAKHEAEEARHPARGPVEAAARRGRAPPQTRGVPPVRRRAMRDVPRRPRPRAVPLRGLARGREGEAQIPGPRLKTRPRTSKQGRRQTNHSNHDHLTHRGATIPETTAHASGAGPVRSTRCRLRRRTVSKSAAGARGTGDPGGSGTLRSRWRQGPCSRWLGSSP